MKAKIIQPIILSSILLMLVMPSTGYSALKWLDKVMVLVEDDVILDSEIKRRTKTVTKQLASKGGQLPSEDDIKKQVLERLIMDQIQLQSAARSGVRISDTELNEALNRIAESNNSTIAMMKSDIESDGINFTLFREDIRDEMTISRYRQGAVSRNVFVSEQEVDDILKLINEQGASSVSYHLRHLMIVLPESAGPDAIAAANAKVADIRRRYKDGESFSNLVVAESDGSDAISGGDMGWKGIEQLPTLFSDTAKGLAKGEIGEVIRSSAGLHLLMLEDIKGQEDRRMVNEVNYRHILIKVTTITTNEKAQAQLLSIRREIVDGETDFAEQAKVYSEDLATASEGGDLGWASPDVFKTLYQDKVNNLKDGELSEVFKGSNGWYLVEQLGSRVSDQTKEMKRLQARRILQNRKFAEEQEAWLREIRDQSYVKILSED